MSSKGRLRTKLIAGALVAALAAGGVGTLLANVNPVMAADAGYGADNISNVAIQDYYVKESSYCYTDIPTSKSATSNVMVPAGTVVKGYPNDKKWSDAGEFIPIDYNGKRYFVLRERVEENVAVSSIKLSRTSATLYRMGNGVQLTAAINADASNQTIKWSSSNTSVAIVSANGYVNPINKGTAVITATAANGKKATCKVTVNPITFVKYRAKTTAKLHASANVNSKVYTTLRTGAYLNVYAGSSNNGWFKAYYNSKVCYVRADQVRQAVFASSIKLNRSTATVYANGNYLSLKATVGPSNLDYNKTTWKSSNTAVATVSQNGTVVGKKAGTAVITATTSNGKTAKCTVTVKAPVLLHARVTTDTYVRSSPSLYGGTVTTLKEGTLITIIHGANYKKYANGISWYKVYYRGAYRYIAGSNIRTVVEASSVKLNRTSLKLPKGVSFLLGATISPSNAEIKTIKWSSSNTNVATVSSNGLVTTRGNGTAKITAKTSNGKTATCTVTVGTPDYLNYETIDSNVAYRSAPSTAGRVIGRLPYGKQIRIVKGYAYYSSGIMWRLVYIDGGYYYIADDYIDEYMDYGNIDNGSSIDSGESYTPVGIKIPASIWVRQTVGDNCTQGAATMLIRGAAYIMGQKGLIASNAYQSVTVDDAMTGRGNGSAGGSCLRNEFTYTNWGYTIYISHNTFAGSKPGMISILSSHPEGIEIHGTNGNGTHAFYINRDSNNNIFKLDPWGPGDDTYAYKYIPFSQGTFSMSNYASFTQYWYVSKVVNNKTGKTISLK